jgi:hypothetical protein
MTNEKLIAEAIKIQENLTKVNEDEEPIKGNPAKGLRCEWNDGKARKIDFIPADNFSGMSVYVYTDDLCTAKMGLSTKAAITLSEGIMKMLRDNKEFLAKLKEPTKENK